MAARKGGPGRWGVGQNTGSLNDSPFKGSDPISQIAAFAWRLPGAVASGRKMNGQKVSPEEWSGLAAMAALTGAGIYAARSGGRTLPRTPGARPMTTAQRSVAVTRAGRTGVGKIGPSIKPKDPYKGEMWDGDFQEPFSSYDSAYARAGDIFDARKLQRTAGGPGRFSYTRPDLLRPVTGRVVNNRYKGFTQTVNIPDFFDEMDILGNGGGSGGVDFDMITNAMKKTLDWRAARKAASVKRRTGR